MTRCLCPVCGVRACCVAETGGSSWPGLPAKALFFDAEGKVGEDRRGKGESGSLVNGRDVSMYTTVCVVRTFVAGMDAHGIDVFLWGCVLGRSGRVA